MNPSLGHSVHNTRHRHKQWKIGKQSHPLTKAKVLEPATIGFDFGPEGTIDARYQRRIEELKKFQQAYGHCRVPENFPENQAFSDWVKSLQSRSQRLSEKQLVELNNIGFDWADEVMPKHSFGSSELGEATPEKIAQYRLKELNHFRQKLGQVIPSNVGLDSSKSAKSIPEQNWHQRLQERKDLQQNCGHRRVPSYINFDKSVLEQATYVQSLQQQLQELQRLQTQLQELNDSQQKHGHRCVPSNDGFDSSESSGKATPAQLYWPHLLQELKIFRQKHGHCRVPSNVLEYRPLLLWISRVRGMYMKHRNGEKTCLTEARIVELGRLGFEWTVREESRRKRGGEKK